MGKSISQSTSVSSRLITLYRWTVLGLLAGIGLVALFSADQSIRLTQQQEQKSHLDKITRLVEARLNTAIQLPLNTVAGMQSFMLATPALPDFKSFDRYAANMLRHTSSVSGFAYVDKQRTIRHFYPLTGNEKAIGLDLMTRPAAPYVEKAIREHRMIIGPPTVTVQGHLSTIARIPLYRDDKLLGLLQAVIDIGKTLQLITSDLDDDVRVYLEDSAGKRFWGPSRYPAQAGKVVLDVGDTQWLARVWLLPEGGDGGNETLMIWSIGGVLLLSMLFMVNRSFMQGQRLSTLVQAKTAQLTASEARWRALLDQVHLVGVGLDRKGLVSYVNPFFCRISGYGVREVIGRNWFSDFLPPGVQQPTLNVFAKLRDGSLANQHLNPILTKTGEERVISWFNARILDDRGEFDGSLSIGEDITARQELEIRLDYLAYHDTLTGLPNRALFLDRVEHAVNRALRDNTLLALMMIDLDQFKTINDSLGHFAGDMLLQAAAQRFHKVIRTADTVARLGGDEFTILLENVKHVSVIEDVADKILKVFAEPFEIGNNKLYISASVGIVMYPMSDDEIEDLLRAADTAMYHAKASGRNCYRFYQASMAAMAHNQLNLANNLHDALQNDDFSLVFQPIVNLINRKTTGFESLLRWQHADLGSVSPAEFIPVAESTGIIIQLGYWVLRHACRSFTELRSVANSKITLSVNVSGYQFRDRHFVSTFRRILEEEGMLPQDLVVEITESQLMEETQVALQVLHAIRDMGCRVAIDDFGTGYSSLSYLRIFPVDILKIDRSFVADMASDANSIALLKAILMIADSLHIEVVAEGLETAEQLTILKSLGITRGQGYYLGKPLPLVAVPASDN
jgi:diguanylate cyclase (GGDEF)-like protein/PAS domain S-box-containing protein